MYRITAIISAYNEEDNIKTVLKSIYQNKFINEIIVVDDGSIDKTLDKIQLFPNIKIIKHKANLGKAQAIKSGVLQSSNNAILLLDADIPNITSQNLENIIRPVIHNHIDVTIALIGNTIQRLIKTDILSGIKCTKKQHIINVINKYHPHGYEFEILFNKYILDNNLTFCFIDWSNSFFKYSTNKYGVLPGLKRILEKRVNIYKRIGIINFYKQYLKMFWRKKNFIS